MIKIIAKVKSEFQKGEILSREIECESVGEIEQFLSYYRSYIVEIEFQGKLSQEEEE
jgi:hypothetical protein